MTETAGSEIPLCVDLDGTITKTDTLVEGFIVAMRTRPLSTLASFLEMRHGISAWKHRIAELAHPDFSLLPYDSKVVELISRARLENRPTFLVSAANESYARRAAKHLGIFDRVFASTQDVNLKAQAKADFLLTRFGEGRYDFVGDSNADLPALANARIAYVVRRSPKVQRKLAKQRDYEIVGESRRNGLLRAIVSQIRAYQWAKNLLVFLPLLAAQLVTDNDAIKASILAFFAFSFVASAMYIINDIADIKHDRSHPSKRFRPFAAGDLSLGLGFVVGIALLAGSMALTVTLPSLFGAALLLYFLTALSYTLWAKNIAVLDTIFLAGLYTTRILAGAAAIQVVPSFWLLAFSMFLFLSIALAKRYSELLRSDIQDNKSTPGRQYRRSDMPTILAEGTASGIAAIVVFALYINNETIAGSFERPVALWLLCPLLLYWVNKLWLNTLRDEVHDDPLVWALTNRVSRGITVCAAVLFLVAIW